MALSYLPLNGLEFLHFRQFGSGDRPDARGGGAIRARDTMAGAPESSSIETNASPTFSLVMASAVLKAGFCRKVSAATLDRLLVARGEGAERMLDAIAKLAEHDIRHVDRVLGDEIDADALAADQPHHLFDGAQAALWAHR